MNSTRLQNPALAAVLGGLVYAFVGAIQVTHDFGGTHNTIDSTAEYLVTGALPLAVLLTAPAYRVLGRLAGSPRTALIATVPQLIIGAMCVISVINGEDASFFNAVAPLCLLTWLVSSIVLGVKLRRTNAVPKAVAIAIPLLVPITFMLSPIGGGMLTGAFWMTLGTHALREGEPQPATATA
jgi:hypothetical protein